nr:GIY-YIG nuclease family protein [Candidatus Sigynarchaeum springense]
MFARRPASIEVGKLGTVKVSPDRSYIYVGSALNGLARRIGRYLAAPAKKKHWHVDYLLEHLDIRAIYLAITNTRKECEISMALNAIGGHFTPIMGFGNSDCDTCPSHLYEAIVGDEPDALDKMVLAAFRGAGLQPSMVNLAND